MKTKAVIIDDEAKARSNIRNMAEMLSLPLEFIGEAEDVDAAYELLIQKQPELVFLDIQMPGGSGFSLLKRFRQIPFQVIFITAFDEYALQAFRFSAVDYLLKPINPMDFEKAVQKVTDKQKLAPSYNAMMETLMENIENRSANKKIVLKTSEHIVVAKITDIIRCESDKGYTEFHLNNGRKVLVSQVLKTFESLLAGQGFVKTHQSHMINPDFMDSYIKSDGGYILMKDQSTVPVSRRQKETLLSFLDTL